jgi:hypothetical protein
MTTNPVFCFDMDGTIADLYGVENWLPMIRAYDATPYMNARPLLNLSALARQLNAAQRKGAKLVIISWASKDPDPDFYEDVLAAKVEWLAEHLPSVHWDEVFITPYGHNKAKQCGVTGEDFILFDDEERNRNQWKELDGLAFNPSDIVSILRQFNRGA